MRRSRSIPVVVLAVASTLLLAAEAAAQAGASVAAVRAAPPPRLPDGRPDLQGTWNIATLTPLERPADLAGRRALTGEEASAIEGQTARAAAEDNRTRAPKQQAPPAGASVGTYNSFWMDAGTAVAIVDGEKRTSLVVDPPDGQIPFRPEARAAERRATARYGVGPYAAYTDLDTGERCLTDGIPWTPGAYNNNFRIVQTSGYVVIFHEQFAELRIIPTDPRPHSREALRQWAGTSQGRWDGDTLVVETLDFADKAHYEWINPWRAARSTLRLVERFTLVDAVTIHYQFTVEDPTTFTSPWTAVVPMVRTDDRIFEYACHEGNYAMESVLKGERLLERQR